MTNPTNTHPPNPASGCAADESQHTPEPWHSEKTHDGWIVGAGEIKGTDYVADVHRHTVPNSDEQSEANMNLITAAPNTKSQRDELLTALKLALPFVKAFAVTRPTDEELTGILDAIERCKQ